MNAFVTLDAFRERRRLRRGADIDREFLPAALEILER